MIKAITKYRFNWHLYVIMKFLCIFKHYFKLKMVLLFSSTFNVKQKNWSIRMKTKQKSAKSLYNDHRTLLIDSFKWLNWTYTFFNFKLELYFAIAPAASKFHAHYKNSLKWLLKKVIILQHQSKFVTTDSRQAVADYILRSFCVFFIQTSHCRGSLFPYCQPSHVHLHIFFSTNLSIQPTCNNVKFLSLIKNDLMTRPLKNKNARTNPIYNLSSKRLKLSARELHQWRIK